MRHLPDNYCGLTIVLSQPSRFDLDNKYLLSGWAGKFVEDELGKHGINRFNCDIRISSSYGDGLLPETKVLLLLGEGAFKTWTQGGYSNNTLNEQRGYPLTFREDVSCLCSYSPQDCFDMQDYESRLNPLLKDLDNEDNEDDEDEETDTSVKRHGRTSRSNFKFWLSRDIGKAIWRLNNREVVAPNPEVRIYPRAEEVIEVLTNTKERELYLDIETDLAEQNLLCLGFSFSLSNIVYVVPFLRYDYTLAYSNDYHKILRALSIGVRNNVVVAHNSMFDLSVMACKYAIPIPTAIFDTMLAQHRCFPEAEKSLGHSLSAWPSIWSMPFHKDEGVFPPHNIQQERELWNYNAKDVWAMKLIKQEQLLHAAADEGLWASIKQANSLPYPYLVCQLTGMLYDTEAALNIRKLNDCLMTYYLKAIKILVGYEVLPTSPKQCQKYFFEALRYKPTMKTKTGLPATGEDALQKLKLKYPLNAVIDFMIAYRERAKESGMLKFTPLPE